MNKLFKLILIAGLMFIAACAQTQPQLESVASKPVAQAQPEQVIKPQVLEPEIKLPQEQQVQQSTPIVIDQSSSIKEPVKQAVKMSCNDACEDDCEQAAQSACSQDNRAKCKSNCGDIIDPSACSQACSFISQQGSCKSQFVQFCSSRCVELCY